MRFFTLPRIQSLATKFALASGAPFVVAAIILGLLVDFQLRSVSMSTEFSQVDEDVLFLVDEVRTLGDELKAQNQECVEPDVLVSAVEGSGGATFRFEPSACPAMGEPYKPALKATCFEQACVATLEVPHRRRVAFRAVALGSATCGIEGVPSIPGPDGCLFVWRDLTVHNQRVLGSRISAAIALVSAILISGLTAIVLANRVGRRISNINETFATFASGERTAQLTDPGQNDELADLASSVNTALRQIQQDIAASDRVNASLSHQLVAPIRQVRDTSRNALVKLTEVSRSGEPVEGQANTIRRVTEELEQVETELGHIVKIGEALQIS
jgi:HAMP domain-containing protein